MYKSHSNKNEGLHDNVKGLAGQQAGTTVLRELLHI